MDKFSTNYHLSVIFLCTFIGLVWLNILSYLHFIIIIVGIIFPGGLTRNPQALNENTPSASLSVSVSIWYRNNIYLTIIVDIDFIYSKQ